MTKERDRELAEIDRFTSSSFEQGLGWYRSYALSLAVGNGAGLLGYFNVAARPDTDLPSGALVAGACFLIGLLAASAVTRLRGDERILASKMSSATGDWHRAGEPNDELGLAIARTAIEVRSAQGLVRIAEGTAAVAFVIGALYALIQTV